MLGKNNVKVLFRKAKALTRMFMFEESREILSKMDLKEAKTEMRNIDLINEQLNGNYENFQKDQDYFMKE